MALHVCVCVCVSSESEQTPVQQPPLQGDPGDVWTSGQTGQDPPACAKDQDCRAAEDLHPHCQDHRQGFRSQVWKKTTLVISPMSTLKHKFHWCGGRKMLYAMLIVLRLAVLIALMLIMRLDSQLPDSSFQLR